MNQLRSFNVYDEDGIPYGTVVSVAYYPLIYGYILGCHTAGIVLSHIIMKLEGSHEIILDDIEIMVRLHIKKKRFATIKEKIKKCGILSVKVKGCPATTHYKLNSEKHVEIIDKFQNSKIYREAIK